MSHEYLKTTEGRSKARQEHQEAIAELELQSKKLHSQLDHLRQDNSGNLTEREKIWACISASKRKGILFLIAGIVAIILALIFFQQSRLMWGILSCLVCAGSLILSIRFFIDIKKYNNPLSALNTALHNYDLEKAKIDNILLPIEREVNERKEFVEYINKWDRDPVFYSFADDIKYGHVGIYVTTEAHPFDISPTKPRAKKYNNLTLQNATAYVNGIACTTVYKNGSDRCLDIFQLDKGFVKTLSGTQPLRITVNYEIGGRVQCDWTSEPIPVSSSDFSNFVWIHLCTYSKGTQPYLRVYESVDDFMSETGITRNEILKKFGYE